MSASWVRCEITRVEDTGPCLPAQPARPYTELIADTLDRAIKDGRANQELAAIFEVIAKGRKR